MTAHIASGSLVPIRFARALCALAVFALTLAPIVGALPVARAADPVSKGTDADKVSFFKQVRPILQANCVGCHQPAKAGGGYVMTDFARLFMAGESGDKPIRAGQPTESAFFEQIAPRTGKPAMPKGKAPLAKDEVELIRRWIAEGASDDTPGRSGPAIDMTNPPVYSRAPVIGSLDFSNDGNYLAIAGFHEVLLFDGAGEKRLARLVGLSERVESVKFSPDSKFLAVAGGLPARMGEIQVWDVAARKLVLSVAQTYDTLFGVNWSPDGSLISFGCTDNSVRAINSKTGEQVLFQGSHTDWVVDTAFSTDGSHLISVSRDRTAKLTEVATQRFIDNITSITPGALKGGIQAITRHPERDEIIVGGADGAPKIFRIYRQTARKIGDDANLIRQLPKLPGRINAVAVSANGRKLAAVSSLDGTGEVHLFGYDFDTQMPDRIKAIQSKVVSQRTPDEQAAYEKYLGDGVKLLSSQTVKTAGLYSVAFHPKTDQVVTAGSDGVVRVFDGQKLLPVREFSPAPVQTTSQAAKTPTRVNPAKYQTQVAESEKLPAQAKVTGLRVEPARVTIEGPFAYAQLLVHATLDSGDVVDATRLAKLSLAGEAAEVYPTGLIQGRADGTASLSVTLHGQTASVPVEVRGMAANRPLSFVKDVNPVLSKLGCNQGTCHGAAQGKNGFKLSLRGYDPLFDVRAFTDDHASRRVDLASPETSLMLLKATGAVPHVGGQLTQPGEMYYEIIRRWIAEGAKLDLSTSKVASIEISPLNPVIQIVGSQQQLRVEAVFTDGTRRDVSHEAFIESGNIEVATANRVGLMTSLRRGEVPTLVRYEGNYAATTLTVMGNRDGFVWKDPPSYNRIDELAALKWKRMKIEPSGLCTDAEFIRRVSIDLTGLPPTAEQTAKFLADASPSKAKREALVDELIGSEDFIDHWTNKWADLLQVNRKFLGVEGAAAFRKWIRDEVAKNSPYDQFAQRILTAKGSNRENPAASYFKILRDPAATMENTTHLFLGVRFNCNKCHDHPFERWTQDQYFQTAAFFSQFSLAKDPVGNNPNIGGTAVEGAKPMYEVVADKSSGDIVHERTGQPAAPKFPFDCDHQVGESASRREQLAAWLSSRDNPYFAKSYVNRLWGYLFGVGIMEPIDDLRAGNPPSNPELLAFLTEEFLDKDFDVRHMLRLICTSRTYQLSVESNRWNDDDKTNYSHSIPRRLSAESLYDAVHRVTGAVSKFPGVKPGTRAAQLPDTGVDLPSGFFATLGRPPRESACECERVSGVQLGPVMALINGATIADAIGDAENELVKLEASEKDDRRLVDMVFLRVLNRRASNKEIDSTLQLLSQLDQDHARLTAAVDQRTKEWAPTLARLEKERLEAIALATKLVAQHEAAIAPQVAQQEKQRQTRITQLADDLKKYEATLAARQAEWELQQTGAIPWTNLVFQTLTTNNNGKLTQGKDGAILASGPAGKAIYTLTGESTDQKISGFRLEALTDPKLPNNGPGRSANGNFVLNEVEIFAAPKNKPTEFIKVELQRPRADFTQDNFDAKQLIDSANAQNNGWAITAGGNVRWVTLETKQPIGFPEGTIFKIVLYQQFNQNDFTLGRFRLSTTSGPRPIGLGLAEPLREALAPEKPTPEQRALVTNYYKGTDTGIRSRQKELAEARKPLPIDPRLKELKDQLDLVSRPVPPDRKLEQLKADLEMSTKQMQNKRLTLVQDLTWALINSPSFLFNH